MDVKASIIAFVATLLLTPFAIAALGHLFRPGIAGLLMNDSEVVRRNGNAYHMAGLFFVAGLLWPVVYEQNAGASISGTNILALSLSSSVAFPVAYLATRSALGGPGISECLRYGEIRDGVSSKGQVAIFAIWSIAAVCASIVALAKLA